MGSNFLYGANKGGGKKGSVATFGLLKNRLVEFVID